MDPLAEEPTFRVVLVDSDEDVRALLEVILAFAPQFQVVGAAGDGHEGVGLVRRLEPDIVAMNLELPDIDALEAITLIRDESPATKIVVFSSVPDPITLVEVVRRGADGYLDKENAWSELIPTMSSVCGQPAEAGDVKAS
jgi:DNA-binding NarL/FixJ family response regulator